MWNRELWIILKTNRKKYKHSKFEMGEGCWKSSWSSDNEDMYHRINENRPIWTKIIKKKKVNRISRKKYHMGIIYNRKKSWRETKKRKTMTGIYIYI